MFGGRTKMKEYKMPTKLKKHRKRMLQKKLSKGRLKAWDRKQVTHCIFCEVKLPRKSRHHDKCHACWLKGHGSK